MGRGITGGGGGNEIFGGVVTGALTGGVATGAVTGWVTGVLAGGCVLAGGVVLAGGCVLAGGVVVAGNCEGSSGAGGSTFGSSTFDSRELVGGTGVLCKMRSRSSCACTQVPARFASSLPEENKVKPLAWIGSSSVRMSSDPDGKSAKCITS